MLILYRKGGAMRRQNGRSGHRNQILKADGLFAFTARRRDFGPNGVAERLSASPAFLEPRRARAGEPVADDLVEGGPPSSSKAQRSVPRTQAPAARSARQHQSLS